MNIAINKLQEIIQNKLEEFNKKVFNEILMKCEDSIKGLKQNAIGCTQKCKFCNRKCELLQHST